MMNSNKWHTLTKIIKAGEGKNFSDVRIPGVPIYQTTNFLYPDVDLGTEILLGQKPGHIYSRYTNPTVDTLNEIMAVLENAESALSFASGMAAISSAVLAYCQPGDHIVSSSIIYGGTFTFFQKQLSRLNIEVTFVDPRDHAMVAAAVRPNTKILYTEPLANPTLIASDLKFWSNLARQHKCKLFVDNTFTPPPIIQPLDWGVDLSIHSATKYLGGHSDLMGGIICGAQREIELIKPVVKYYGAVMAPLIAWLLIRGIRTLGVRIERQCENALQLAGYLSNHPKISRVFYAGLEDNPQFALNKNQFNGFSGMLAFEVKGGWPAAKKVMEHLQAILFTVSLGDISSLICHPASTSHVYLSAQERERIGISDGLLRLSVGIEHVADLRQDLEQALAQI
jgi:methionine-gamma-lyase